jgi:outer membrane receptor protein involved in Fe transport
VDKEAKAHDSVGRANLTYKFDDNKLFYATWSQGFRPGGVNRRGNAYIPDYLTNYEFGWKTTWADNRFSFNGAIFQENWDKFQFSFLGQNGLTEIHNAAQGRIRGLETEINWAASYNLVISGGLAFYDPILSANYCGWIIPGTDQPETSCPAGTINPISGDPVDGPLAVKGDRLPVTAKFKGDVNARYTFDWGQGEAFWQVTLSHQGSRRTDLRDFEATLLGDLKAYTLTDFSAGYKQNNWSLDFFLKNAFDNRAQMSRFQECPTAVCGYEPYDVVAQPRTLGVRFSQEF